MGDTEAPIPRWRELDPGLAEGATRLWIESVVVGKGLCPFAHTVRGAPTRVVTTDYAPGERRELLELIGAEVERLAATDSQTPATTLVLLTHEAFGVFDTYMEEAAIEAQDVACQLTDGAIQVVQFHPHARWGALKEAADYSTRSPVPMLHLLRDSDVVQAERDWVRAHGSEERAPDIQQTNAAMLRGMGLDAAHGMWERSLEAARRAESERSCRAPAEPRT
ncbi:hypothetical protein KFE25_006037 [Diacronema lutheri]|uniref:DUF1415 domain-containing protein n=1 Tax=Diacronema lutheri TaxID=2081491 RepID=A0A8J6CC69_DIALT|nr:hypothetical protein KFE25_006037 [Diacronema lutheri]